MSEPLKWKIVVSTDDTEITQVEAVIDTDTEKWNVTNLTMPIEIPKGNLADIWLISANICRGVSNGLMADIEAGKEVKE